MLVVHDSANIIAYMIKMVIWFPTALKFCRFINAKGAPYKMLTPWQSNKVQIPNFSTILKIIFHMGISCKLILTKSSLIRNPKNTEK